MIHPQIGVIMALVNNTGKWIFMHIFKCAGNSAREFLTNNLTHELHGVHVDMRDVQRHYAARKQDAFFNSCFKFTFIRNPFDWVVSNYFYIRRGKKHKYYPQAIAFDFPKFCRFWVDVGMNDPRPYGANKIMTFKQFIHNERGQRIVDFVGRLETMQEDFDTICDKIHLLPQILKYLNAGVGRNRKLDYKQYYNAEAKQIITKAYQEDLDYFDYSF